MPTERIPKFNQIQIEEIVNMFTALADCSRLIILDALRQSPTFVTDLSRKTGLKQANLSKQLSILRTAALVKSRRQGNRILYEISEPIVFDLCNLVCQKVQQDAHHRAKVLITSEELE